jgi:hypothetical protein
MDYISKAETAGSLKRQLDLFKEGHETEAMAEEQLLKENLTRLNEIKELIIKCNNPAIVIDDNTEEQLYRLAGYTYLDEVGMEQPYLTSNELENLCIRHGTLTESERKIMEQHVEITARMLDKISFIKKFRDVPKLASMHHELLDGNGYPCGLTGDDIPLESRILALVDIYDALTACDRPYKEAVPCEDALRILSYMVKEGKLDAELFEIFKEHRVWEQVSNLNSNKL